MLTLNSHYTRRCKPTGQPTMKIEVTKQKKKQLLHCQLAKQKAQPESVVNMGAGGAEMLRFLQRYFISRLRSA